MQVFFSLNKRFLLNGSFIIERQIEEFFRIFTFLPAHNGKISSVHVDKKNTKSGLQS